MTQLSLEAIQKQHEKLLKLNEGAVTSETNVTQVEEFLKQLAAAGAYIEDPDQRSLLRAYIRYWANFVDDQISRFPFIQLQPFNTSQLALKSTVNQSLKSRRDQSDITRRTVTLSNERQTVVVEAPTSATVSEIITTLGLEKPKKVILILGGNDIPNAELQARLPRLFSRGLARAITGSSALIINGSTRSELITTLGKALAEHTDKVPLLSVTNDYQVTKLGQDDVDGSLPELNHTHLLVIKSASPNIAIDKMYEVADALSQSVPILSVLANDNSVVKYEVLGSVRREWPILVIKGSGGFADEIQHAWQDKQNYIKKLSAWKPMSSDESKPAPHFIADPVLSEIIDEGDLHFFSITDTPENLEQCIDLRLITKNILNRADMQWRIYSTNAMQQQKRIGRLQSWILFLAVFLIALAAFHSFYGQMQWRVQWNIFSPLGTFRINLEDLLYPVLLFLSALLALLIAGANRFNTGSKWIKMRIAAEVIEQEMFRYRTRTSIYSDIQVVQSGTSREATLARMLEAITGQWVEDNLDYAIFPASVQSSSTQQTQTRATAALSKQGKPKYNISAYLPPSHYMTDRVNSKLEYYKKNSLELGRLLSWLQWLILGLGGAATLLVAFHADLVITVTTASAIALVAYLEYNQVGNTLKQYNHAILNLTNIQNWWVSLGNLQADLDNIDKLVDNVETTIQSEQAGWIQQLKAALTDLRMQQAKQIPDAFANKLGQAKTEFGATSKLTVDTDSNEVVEDSVK